MKRARKEKKAESISAVTGVRKKKIARWLAGITPKNAVQWRKKKMIKFLLGVLTGYILCAVLSANGREEK